MVAPGDSWEICEEETTIESIVDDRTTNPVEVGAAWGARRSAPTWTEAIAGDVADPKPTPWTSAWSAPAALR